ncbi:MAG: hypothetical protein ACTIKA_05950 [Psychroflexus halocasei]|uniref:hypothetical protein n=1 Tax=Psychroflexus sp. S27 TaxID=1982757 RepID=UPI000C2AB97B|nr:hypothetical protein [Psychroflexus sp. S27]PJX23332.1 hypothetical protein CAP47_06395 [Psychroflexus sp. S27]
MKKFFTIIVLGAMTIGMSSFGIAEEQGEDCTKLMDNVYGAYLDAGYDTEHSFESAISAYEGCVENGGSESHIN